MTSPATRRPVNVAWDGAPVRQSFGACNVVFDGVAYVGGKSYRVNVTATRGARKPEVMLRYLTPAKSGQAVPEFALADIRAAVVELATAHLAPMRAAVVDHARRVAARFGEDNPTADEIEARVDAINPASLVGQPADVVAAARGVDLSKPDLPARPAVTVDDFPPAVATVDVTRPQVRRDNAEWHAGRDARAAGEPLEACPYSAGGERAARWDLGWREASPSHRRCGAVRVIGRRLEAIRALVDGPLGERGPTTERTADGMESILEALEGVAVKAQALRDGRPLSSLWIVDGKGDYRAGPYDTWAAADSALAMLRMDRKPDAGSLRVDGGR